MAILPEDPSPVPSTVEKTKTGESSSKIKNYLNTFSTRFLAFTGHFFKAPVAKIELENGLTQSRFASLSTRLKNVKNFFVGTYLPHSSIVFLALVVGISNTQDRIIASTSYNDLVYVDPEIEQGIVQNVDLFTPLISNDPIIVSKATLASLTSDGFASTMGPVETVITARELPLPDNSNGTVEYVVRDGDSLSLIGWKFGIKLATLKYVNDIDNVNVVRPGAVLKVPKRGYEVSAELIAKRERERAAKLALGSRNTLTRSGATSRSGITVRTAAGSKYNGYPYGYCTYYVATRRLVPTRWGDAKAWLGSAQRAGYQTGSEPAVGAIVVTRESWWGHVAFVEAVNGSTITISEMNARGWGVISTRTIAAYGGVVRGYIY